MDNMDNISEFLYIQNTCLQMLYTQYLHYKSANQNYKYSWVILDSSSEVKRFVFCQNRNSTNTLSLLIEIKLN